MQSSAQCMFTTDVYSIQKRPVLRALSIVPGACCASRKCRWDGTEMKRGKLNSNKRVATLYYNCANVQTVFRNQMRYFYLKFKIVGRYSYVVSNINLPDSLLDSYFLSTHLIGYTNRIMGNSRVRLLDSYYVRNRYFSPGTRSIHLRQLIIQSVAYSTEKVVTY